MACSQHFGWNKDGTSKKKIKILENTVTLSTGQSLPTGYHKTARETAEDISSGVQSELKELSAILSGSGLSSETNSVNPVIVRKLSYFMTDRAANEKKPELRVNQMDSPGGWYGSNCPLLRGSCSPGISEI